MDSDCDFSDNFSEDEYTDEEYLISDNEDNLFVDLEYLDDNEDLDETNILFQTPPTGDVFTWEEGEFSPKIHPFDDSLSGCKIDLSASDKESDFFKYFVDEEIVTRLVIKTNHRYAKIAESESNLSMRLKRWVDTNNDEMYVFLAILLLLPLNSRNTIDSHWSTNPLLYSPIFSDTMPRDRFVLLLRMLNFSDEEEREIGNRLSKIKIILDMFRRKFSSGCSPHQKICIDESLLLFKGRLIFRQFIPSKASRFGIKLFVLCDCITGYVLDIIVYTGATTEYAIVTDLGAGATIVMSLLSKYLDAGHTIYLDNWYTSPKLFQALHEKKTNAVGTVRRNRIGMPKFPKKLKKGESIALHTDTMMAQTWRDKRDVTMLSTIHTAEFVETGKTDYRTGAPKTKPSAADDYSKNMGKVDRSDMMISFVKSTRKTMKWHKKLFLHLIDLSMFNAHAMYMKKSGTRISLGSFALKVIKQLLDEHNKKTNTRKRKSVTLHSRIGANTHFMDFLPTSTSEPSTSARSISRRRCVVCAASKKRTSTKFFCKQCNVSLCAVPCFETYHTKINF
jgi:hypothetical protein